MYFVVERNAAAFNLAQVFAPQQGRCGRDLKRERGDGAVDLRPEIADAQHGIPLRYVCLESGFPTSGTLGAQVRIGECCLLADLSRAVQFVLRWGAIGAKCRSVQGEVSCDAARDSDARIEDRFAERRHCLWPRWRPLLGIEV